MTLEQNSDVLPMVWPLVIHKIDSQKNIVIENIPRYIILYNTQPCSMSSIQSFDWQCFVKYSWHIDGILPIGPYPPCLRMADRALFAGYPRYFHRLPEHELLSGGVHYPVLLGVFPELEYIYVILHFRPSDFRSSETQGTHLLRSSL